MHIAILMATYNGERYIAAQIDSIIQQTNQDWNLYIRDDGSKDSTLDIVSSYVAINDKIHLVKDDYTRHGAKWNFMHLLEMVDADYYMFCDQDDVWLPNKIDRSLSEMKKIETDDKPVLVCSDLRVVDQSLNTIYESFWNYMKLVPSLLMMKKYAVSCNLFTGCTMMFNRSTKMISFPVSEDFILHDYWVGLNVIAHQGNIVAIPEKLMLYRQHQNNVCGAQPIGKSLSYYMGKISGLQNVIQDYKEKVCMANAIFHGRIGWAYFLLNRLVYLMRR